MKPNIFQWYFVKAEPSQKLLTDKNTAQQLFY